MTPRLVALSLASLLGCARADEGSGERGGADAQALQAATAELEATRAALQAERAATTQELAELRKTLGETNAKLAKLEAERRPAVPVPAPVDPYALLDPAMPPMSVEPGVPPPSDPTLEGLARCDLDTHCKIQQAWFESMIDDPIRFAKQTRIVPNIRDGVTLGYKLYGIRRGSLSKAAGLRNGDLVKSINGYAMGSMEQVIEAFSKLRRAKTFTLELERRGVGLTHTVEIVDHL